MPTPASYAFKSASRTPATYTFKSAGVKDWFQRTSPLHDLYNAHAGDIFTRAHDNPLLSRLAKGVQTASGRVMSNDSRVSRRLGLYRPTQSVPEVITQRTLTQDAIPEHIREIMRRRSLGE